VIVVRSLAGADRLWGPPSNQFSLCYELYPDVKRLGYEKDHVPYLMPRLRMGGAISPFRDMPLWREVEQSYIILPLELSDYD
jgi:hypothetical protein